MYFSVEARQRGRFAGFSIFLSNIDVSSTEDIKRFNLCYKDGPQLPPLNITITCTGYARYIIYYNERFDGGPYPNDYELTSVHTELCEVIVQGTHLIYKSMTIIIIIIIKNLLTE